MWAEHWYASTHRSSGFQAGPPSAEPVPDPLHPVVDAARPYYDRLLEPALVA